jgi:S1-C subfamily serine protease
MKCAPIFNLLGAALLAAAPLRAEPTNLLQSVEAEVKNILATAGPSVVKIHAYRHIQIGNLPLAPTHRVGTGFFAGPDGVVLTAGTVLGDADTCWIEWQEEKLPARILGRCPRVNLAVLQAEKRNATFPALPLCRAPDYSVGSLVVALGFPYDLPLGPVVGFIQGVDIRCGNQLFPTSHIRANCKLSPGQGGGPLLNARGEVIGIVVAAHPSDQCYALPICAAKKVLTDIRQTGQPQHPWVGLEVTERELLPVTPGEPFHRWQIYVREVMSNTPAARAGFQDRDQILRIGTNQVHRLADVLDEIFQRRAGDNLQFTVRRNGAEHTVSLTVAPRPPAVAGSAAPLLVPAVSE